MVVFLEIFSEFVIGVFYFFFLKELLKLVIFIILFFIKFVCYDILDLEERSCICSIILDVVLFVVIEMFGMFS